MRESKKIKRLRMAIILFSLTLLLLFVAALFFAKDFFLIANDFSQSFH